MSDWPTEISHLQVPGLDDSDGSSGDATPLPGTPKAPPPSHPPPVTKPKFLELSDDILYADESHVESSPPSALGLDSLLPRLNWIGSMSEPAATTDDGRELSTAEIYERNQKLLDESIPDVPLVSDLLPMAALRAEYENGSAAYRSQIDWLVAQGYTGIRRARGDGDCFYRSLAFAYIERLLQTPPEELEVSVASSLSILQGTRQTILLAGTDEFILEDPYEMITSIIQNIVTPNSKGNTLTPEKLLARFQDQGAGSMDAEDEPVAAYIVYYLRMITSAHIKNNAADYEPFFEDGISARDFCSRQVDPVGIEADHIQMGALCKELKVNLKVAYLDGHQSDKVDFVTFDEGPSGGDPITLLYRPGHYDILAKGGLH